MLCAAVGVIMSLAASEDTGRTMPVLRVTSVQMEVTDDLSVNLARILRGVAEAADAGARIAVFPETALSGFSEEAVAALDWDTLEEAMAQVSAAASDHNIYVLYGCATPSGAEQPFNSAILVGPDGTEIMRYHKMVPEAYFEPGDHLALFDIDGVPCTAMVCHDERFPELVRIPTLAGARICFYISYEINGLESALRKMEGYRAQLIARAVENGIWVVQANGIGPLAHPVRVSLGQSRVIDPGGIVVEEAPALRDCLVTADVDPTQAHRGNALESLDIAPLRGWWHGAVNALTPPPLAGDAAPARNDARLALMQDMPEKWNLDANFEVFLAQLAEADAQDADIFITPECWLDGYAAPDPQSTPERLREVAQPLDTSPYLARVAREARERAMYVCFGFTSLEDGKIYNAAGLWNDAGELLGVYHKTHLQTHDLQFSPGEALPVWPTPWGPLGIMICADRRWPETARVLRLQGARLILNPTYGMHHEKNEWWMRTRGFENQCFIAFAHPNVGFVVDPRGDIAGKRDESPGVLICDVDLGRATDDNHLRDRRPDLYGIIAQPTFRQDDAGR